MERLQLNSCSSLSEDDKFSSDTVGSVTGCVHSPCAIDFRHPERDSLDNVLGFFVLVDSDCSSVLIANSEVRKEEVTSSF